MLPPTVARTMNVLCESLQARLPGVVEAVYVYGEDIEIALPGTDIMGSYILRRDLGRIGEPSPLAVYYNKQLRSDLTGADLNPITRWVLKHKGIRVFGAEVPFDYKTPVDELVYYVKENMNSYWVGWINRLQEQLQVLGELGKPAHSEHSKSPIGINAAIRQQLDEAVEWCVLGMLRQLYTIREQDVTSKLGAGEYGLRVLSERWHPLIREALAIKQRKPEREYGSQLERLRDLVGLLKVIHVLSYY